MKLTAKPRPYPGLPRDLKKYLKYGYFRTIRRVFRGKYSKSYIFKVCEGWRQNDEIMNELMTLALENKAHEASNKDGKVH